MRRNNLFWGVVLILLGGLFLLQAMGLISDVLGWFWPLGLILIGIWIIWGRFLPHGSGFGDTFSIDLQGASRLELVVEHGAGSLSLSGGAQPGVAVSGNTGAALDVSHRLETDSLTVNLKAGPTFIPFIGPESGEWRFNLTQEVPVGIKLDSGASSLNLDLTDIKLTFLGIDSGASGIKVKIPTNAGRSLVDIEAGAASIDLLVPGDVGARIRLEQGASSIKIDEKRFPRVAQMNNLFESEGFESAVNKVEMNIEGGASSVFVH